MDALSADEGDDPTRIAEIHAAAEAAAGAKRARQSRVAQNRAKGSGKRVDAYTMPIPINYQKTVDGTYQQYKLPDSAKNYSRRAYTYTSELKVGAPTTTVPPPPTLFPDIPYLYKPAGRLLIDIDLAGEDIEDMVPLEKLQRRLEARLMRVAFNSFIGVELTAPPVADKITLGNTWKSLLFGQLSADWSAKQVMAWAWPAIAITGDAAEHYQTGALSRERRFSKALFEITFLGATEGATKFRDVFGSTNRLEELSGDLRGAIALLGVIVREGVLTRASEQDAWVQREGFESLFQEFTVTYGRNSHPRATEQHAEGDAYTFNIFAEPAEQDPPTKIQVDNVDVELDSHGHFFYYCLTETILLNAAARIAKAVCAMKKTYTSARLSFDGDGGDGKRRLNRDGRACVVKLKQILPVLSAPQLKKLLIAAGVTGFASDKDGMMKDLAQFLHPGYPYEDPQASGTGSAEPEEQEGEEQEGAAAAEVDVTEAEAD